MAKPRYKQRKNRALNTLQDKGMGLCALGLAFLIIPWFLGSSPMLKAVATGLRTPGWLALAAGALMLGLHRISKAKLDAGSPLPSLTPQAPTPVEPHILRDIRPNLVSEPRERDVPVQQARQAETSWSPAVFAAIEWRRFEAVCEKLFGQAGFETKSQSHGADGGVDIWLYSRNATGPAAVVQCKHWQGKAVGVKEMREFFGVMASHKLTRGVYATTSTYTADAQQFAKVNSINALDSQGLLELIAKRTPEQQQALLDVAYEGEYWRPTCASCGIKLVERKPAKGGAGFWGCSNYPKCKSRLPMVAALR
ncbi:MAG: restriction endonuclease [Pseudomonadota bacterium]